jgi:hypothetical protein
VFLNVALAIDAEVMREDRRRAEALGSSVNQLVSDYLAAFVGKRDPRGQAADLRRLWNQAPEESLVSPRSTSRSVRNHKSSDPSARAAAVS